MCFFGFSLGFFFVPLRGEEYCITLFEGLLLLSRFSRVRLCNPMDCSLPGSSVHGIFQAKVLEWVAIAFSHLKDWYK